MTKKEFEKLKVGDKVKIVDEWVGEGQNDDGLMDKWLGKVMTIREILTNSLKMVEDKDKWYPEGWFWDRKMIEKKVEDFPTISEHLIRGNKTIVKLSNGKVGIARCNPEDTFDVFEGLKLAAERAYARVKEGSKKPEFYVGQLVQFKTWDEMEREFELDEDGDANCKLHFTKRMKPLCGKFAEITEILPNNGVNLKIYNYTGRMFVYSLDIIKPVED